MPFDASAIRDSASDPINDSISSRYVVTKKVSNASTPQVILDSLTGNIAKRQRELVRWRVPMFGIIDMYINPQSLVIEEKKVIQKQRTKGGYVVQYWGDELATIKLDGHTGSSGIEGINVLRQVYRAEQDAFQSVSQILIDKLNSFTGSNTLQDGIGRASVGAIGKSVSEALPTLLGIAPNPPLLPTLASLATSVEMYYQGWAFRGYFDHFTVTESVSNGVGMFSYSMGFTVLDRRGYRSNFMPWHREPANMSFGRPTSNSYKHSDSAIVPMSFGGEET